MLKLKISNEKPEEKDTVVELGLIEEADGTVVVVSGPEGVESKDWYLVSFKVIDGKINLVRHGYIEDAKYHTDVDGRLKEAEE